jgi:hypothetical protein
MEKLFLRPVKTILPAVLVLITAATIFAQDEKPSPTAKPSPALPAAKLNVKPTTAEDVAELAVFFYAPPGGRATMDQIRKTTQEHGRTSVTNAAGRVDISTYQRFIIRADSLDKEKIRVDQELPTAKFSLIYSDDKIFGIYNNSIFPPSEEARRNFENQIFHGLEVLLRYKETGSTLELQPKEKILGVDYYVLDVTDKQGRKTRFYISAKSYRVMMLTYDDGGVKYKRKFYDYNYAQGTLVPSRSVLWADDKIVEESEVLTVTFGQKVDEAMFKAG